MSRILPSINLKTIFIFCSVSLLSFMGFSQVNLDSGLIAYFKLDSNVADSSITGIHGVGSNLTNTSGIQCDTNTAYSFNGTSSKIVCGTNNRGVTNTVNISAWVKTTVNTGHLNIVEKSNWQVDKGYYFSIKNGIPLVGARNTSNSGVNTWNSNQTFSVADGQWHHLLGVVSQNNLEIWVDGVLKATNILSATIPDLTTNYDLNIGYSYIGSLTGTPLYFNGTIDEVRLYNRDLTLVEIDALRTSRNRYVYVSNTVCDSMVSPSGAVWYSSGIYQDTVSNVCLGDSIYTVNLTVLNGSVTPINEITCGTYTSPSGNYTWNSTGTYFDTLTNVLGCDSIIEINLTINAIPVTNLVASNCYSITSPSGNYTWYTTGVYSDTLSTSAGCDSVLSISVTILPYEIIALTQVTCNSYTSPSGNSTWNTSGTYLDVVSHANACDTLYNIFLTVLQSSSSSIVVTSCNAYSSPSGNYTWATSGVYYDTIPNTTGCDSILTINLTVDQSSNATISPSVCASYTSPSGNYVWTNSGTYTDVIPNSVGCDSTITINLLVNNSFATISPTACNSYTSPSGKLWTASGVYQDTIANSVGCDSIISINLTLGTNSLTTENVSSCSSYIWPVNGLTYLNSGTHTEILTSALGCDSVVVLNLTITQLSSSTINVIACNSYVSPSGTNTWTGSGIYTDVIPNNAGCDSTITINLTINNSSNSLQTVASCGAYFWSINGTTYPVGGIYVATVLNSVGCDSVITLNLTINSATSSMVNITNCGSYIWAQNGTTYNASGQYMDTINNSVGCDSIITLNLTINSSSTGSESVSACGSYTSPSGNYTWTVSGTYTDTIPNSVGCDSIITTNLTINGVTSSSQTAMACDSYFWASNSQTYTLSGTYMDTTLNSVGCDSIITLNLTINNSYTSTVPQSACDTYTWPLTGVTYTISGNYSDTMIAVTGCDSIITLNLQINTGDSITENVTSCGSYLWSATGNLYTTSGNFQALLANSNGCDSLVTLSLVIATPSTDTIPMTACDSYQWLLNGNTYTMSGFYTDSLTSVSGCDSLIILDLTVNYSTTGTLTENSCGAYTAPDGSLYTTSGQYTAIIPNSTGCDSVITVNLTVTNIDTTVTQSGFELTAIATGFSYQWLDCDNGMNPISGATNITYVLTANGNYAVEITDGVCLETSNCHKVTGVGVNEIRLAGISVYPNPVFDELKVSNEQGLPLEINVLDLTGRQIRTKKTIAELTTIDFTNLPSGVYLIQIKSNGQVMIEKVTVR